MFTDMSWWMTVDIESLTDRSLSSELQVAKNMASRSIIIDQVELCTIVEQCSMYHYHSVKSWY